MAEPWRYAPALSPGDGQAGSWVSSPSLILPHHELETTLGSNRDYSRPFYVRPLLFQGVGPIGSGSV